MTADLDWVHAIDDIPDTGLKVERAATETERQRVAQVLDLVACTKLMARYTIEPRGSGHFRLAGNVEAEVEQACVVTLEPLTNRIAESFTVDYWPETEIPAAKGGVVDVHDEPDLEPIVAGRLEVGRVIFESLAGAIDLFPRKPGATFESPSAEPAGDGAGRAEGPFAALARMKSKQ